MEKKANHIMPCMFLILMSSMFPSLAWKCKYEVEVRTGNRFSAGTGARVSLKLCDKSDACPVTTDNLADKGAKGESGTYFQRGARDKFVFKDDKDCLEPCKLSLSHDNTGDNPHWFVETVRVRIYDQNDEIGDTTFDVNQWLSKVYPPKSLEAAVDMCYAVIQADISHVLASALLKQYGIA